MLTVDVKQQYNNHIYRYPRVKVTFVVQFELNCMEGATHCNINKQIILRTSYIEDIYFFEVNTKYVSSNVMKISVNSRVRSTSDFSDIFNTFDEIYLAFTEKSKFSLNFFSRKTNGKQTAWKLTCFLVISR